MTLEPHPCVVYVYTPSYHDRSPSSFTLFVHLFVHLLDHTIPGDEPHFLSHQRSLVGVLILPSILDC